VTPEGVSGLITKLIKTYPNTYGDYGREDIRELIETWKIALEDFEDSDVMRAFKAFLVSDQKGFPPAVGQIVARIPHRESRNYDTDSGDEPKRVVLRRSTEYFPGSIEVGNPRTGEIEYVKYEGYPYGEGDKGETEETRVDAIKRWLSNLTVNEQNAWRDHGAVFGDELKKWKDKYEGGQKRATNRQRRPTGKDMGLATGDRRRRLRLRKPERSAESGDGSRRNRTGRHYILPRLRTVLDEPA